MACTGLMVPKEGGTGFLPLRGSQPFGRDFGRRSGAVAYTVFLALPSGGPHGGFRG
jgi:hypothetical protein